MRSVTTAVRRTNARSFLGALLTGLLVLATTGCGADRAEKFGDGWAHEADRTMLSFFVAAAAHGDPPGWQQWEAEHEPSGPADDVYGRRFHPYLVEARQSHRDSAASAFYEQTLDLTGRQRSAVRPDGQEAAVADSSVAADFRSWLDENHDRVESLGPNDVLPLYVSDLEASDQGTARGHLADLEDLLRTADRLGEPAPAASTTFAPDAPPADVTDD